jgi:hypothetical protein
MSVTVQRLAHVAFAVENGSSASFLTRRQCTSSASVGGQGQHARSSCSASATVTELIEP